MPAGGRPRGARLGTRHKARVGRLALRPRADPPDREAAGTRGRSRSRHHCLTGPSDDGMPRAAADHSLTLPGLCGALGPAPCGSGFCGVYCGAAGEVPEAELVAGSVFLPGRRSAVVVPSPALDPTV